MTRYTRITGTGSFLPARRVSNDELAAELAARGITLPVAAGIMPITNATQLLRFSDACGAEVPRWLRLRLEGYGDDLASIRAFGLDVVAALCQRLLQGGAPSLHLYTMNQSEAALALAQRL